jgi:hypothetical protein
MKSKKPKVTVEIVGKMTQQKRRRLKRRFGKLKRKFEQDYERDTIFAPGIREILDESPVTYVLTYFPRQMAASVLELLPTDPTNRFKTLPTASDIVAAMQKGLDDARKKAQQNGVQELSLEVSQLESLSTVFSLLHVLTDIWGKVEREREEERKRFVGLLLEKIIAFGRLSEKKYEDRFEEMTEPRESPDPKLDKKARDIWATQPPEEKNLMEAARQAGKKLRRDTKAIQACADRIRQQEWRRAKGLGKART